MAWYNEAGCSDDTVLCTRISLIRNLRDCPFGDRMDVRGAEEMIDKVCCVLGDRFLREDAGALSPLIAASYAERQWISERFCRRTLPHTLLRRDADGLYVMLGGGDHIVIRCLMPGLALEDAYARAAETERLLSSHLPLAFDEQLGYLTQSPADLGTAMRISVMLFLPALDDSGKIWRLEEELSRTGLLLRGVYGAGSMAEGSLYAVSNRLTLGVSERQLLDAAGDALEQICALERKERAILCSDSGDLLRDRVMRSYGIMRYAARLSVREFMQYLADVRLGGTLGWLDGPDAPALSELMIDAMPASLRLRTDCAGEDSAHQNALRAAMVRSALARA